MDAKEKKVQNALGTRKSIMFASADWKDTDSLVDDFEEAFKNFGLFMYANSEMVGSDMYSFIVSDHELTEKQIKEQSEKAWRYDEDEDN